MNRTFIGQVVPMPSGEHVQGYPYRRLAVVSHEGSGYISKIPNNTQPVTDQDAWMCFARKGVIDINQMTTAEKNEVLTKLFAQIGAVLMLGETATTAFPGNRGKALEQQLGGFSLRLMENEAAYDALEGKDEDTLYIIPE